MIRQIIENLSDVVRNKAVSEFMDCDSMSEVLRVRQKYGLPITDEMLEYMKQLYFLPTLSDEEQEFIAGGKTNFLLNAQSAYKGRL